MGSQICSEQNRQGDYVVVESDTPPSSYAVKVLNEKDLPFGFEYFRSMLKEENTHVPEPEWYQQGDALIVDDIYFITSYGVYYKGGWRKGVPHGKGEVITKDGQYFKGYFKQAIAQGPKCLLISSPTKYYIGEVKNNQKNMKGRFVEDGYSYEGDWENNFPYGKGVQTFPNGDSFKGNFIAGYKQGEGVYTWKEGLFHSYAGNYKKNEIFGDGTLSMRNGQVWSGKFNCADNSFEIENAICNLDQKQFQGKISNCKPIQHFTISNIIGRSTKEEQRGQIFQGKVLLYYNQTVPSLSVRNILNKIETGYEDCQSHQQALSNIQSSLPDYTVNFWTQGQRKQGVLIAPICGRFVKVSERPKKR